MGLGKRQVAARFRVSKDAAFRHAQNHLPPELKAALALKLVRKEGDVRAVLLEEGSNAVEALRAVRGPLFGMFLAAVDVNDTRAAAALSGRIVETISLGARLTGELMPAAGTTIQNIVVSADYIRLRSDLLAALRPFPEAARAVAEAFRRTGERAAVEMQRSVPRIIEGTATEVTDAVAA